MGVVAITMRQPRIDELDGTIGALREWQHDEAPLQLHPGDVGWFWRFGAAATAAALRIWSRNREILAVGLLDGVDLLRLTTAPAHARDEGLSHQLVEDVIGPACGVLPAGRAYVEAPTGALVHDLLDDRGWLTDEPWTPLRHDLTEAVEDSCVRIEVTTPDTVHVRTEVHRASFDRSSLTDDRWHAMASGAPYVDGQCLVAHDEHGDPVAAVTVWSAEPGRPGLLEPMGVHRDHRGHGYGTAICTAAAAALRRLGSSSALVCTRASNVGAVATYVSAGFRPLPERRDHYRDA